MYHHALLLAELFREDELVAIVRPQQLLLEQTFDARAKLGVIIARAEAES